MSDIADPVAALGTVADPALRARLATSVARYLAAVTRAIYDARDAAVVECRSTGSVRETAGQVDLSPSRVHQITGPAPVTAQEPAGPDAPTSGPAPECAPLPVQPSAPGPLLSTRTRKTAGGGDLHTVAEAAS